MKDYRTNGYIPTQTIVLVKFILSFLMLSYFKHANWRKCSRYRLYSVYLSEWGEWIKLFS